MNQLQLKHSFETIPDTIIVKLNNDVVYHGPADVPSIDFFPTPGTNILTVLLESKAQGNFYFNAETNQVEKDSTVLIHELIVESRYFRNLVIKCGLVEVDLKKNLSFPSKYIDHENVLTMEGSEYLIKFEYPVKKWMHIHRFGRDLDKIEITNQRVKERLKNEIHDTNLLQKS